MKKIIKLTLLTLLLNQLSLTQRTTTTTVSFEAEHITRIHPIKKISFNSKGIVMLTNETIYNKNFKIEKSNKNQKYIFSDITCYPNSTICLISDTTEKVSLLNIQQTEITFSKNSQNFKTTFDHLGSMTDEDRTN